VKIFCVKTYNFLDFLCVLQHFQQAFARWFLQVLTRDKGKRCQNYFSRHPQEPPWLGNESLTFPLINFIVFLPFQHFFVSFKANNTLPTPWVCDSPSQPSNIVELD